ncbi:hypothetical protein DPMN_141650 [Dreissena polymorpha]|uniref:Uncharacterized protein n=1 Tax=Dreissena polymorpha TaxID=45954 RepID=A0A9D4JLG4_DREPO|nr:hypothetical protein DPMN_141650 [Dreissena polymorpha]
MDIVSNFHENQEDNVTCRKLYFQPIVTIFDLIQDIIETYILAKFYEDWNIKVASTELTRQLLTAHDGHKAITKPHHEHVAAIGVRGGYNMMFLKKMGAGGGRGYNMMFKKKLRGGYNMMLKKKNWGEGRGTQPQTPTPG